MAADTLCVCPVASGFGFADLVITINTHGAEGLKEVQVLCLLALSEGNDCNACMVHLLLWRAIIRIHALLLHRSCRVLQKGVN